MSMPIKSVYVATERDGTTHWTKVGTAHTNADGSITLKLDALPLSGTIQVRDDVDAVAKKKAKWNSAGTIVLHDGSVIASVTFNGAQWESFVNPNDTQNVHQHKSNAQRWCDAELRSLGYTLE